MLRAIEVKFYSTCLGLHTAVVDSPGVGWRIDEFKDVGGLELKSIGLGPVKIVQIKPIFNPSSLHANLKIRKKRNPLKP